MDSKLDPYFTEPLLQKGVIGNSVSTFTGFLIHKVSPCQGYLRLFRSKQSPLEYSLPNLELLVPSYVPATLSNNLWTYSQVDFNGTVSFAVNGIYFPRFGGELHFHILDESSTYQGAITYRLLGNSTDTIDIPQCNPARGNVGNQNAWQISSLIIGRWGTVSDILPGWRLRLVDQPGLNPRLTESNGGASAESYLTVALPFQTLPLV